MSATVTAEILNPKIVNPIWPRTLFWIQNLCRAITADSEPDLSQNPVLGSESVPPFRVQNHRDNLSISLIFLRFYKGFITFGYSDGTDSEPETAAQILNPKQGSGPNWVHYLGQIGF